MDLVSHQDINFWIKTTDFNFQGCTYLIETVVTLPINIHVANGLPIHGNDVSIQ